MFDADLFKQGYIGITRSGKKAHYVRTVTNYYGDVELLVRVEDYNGILPYKESGCIDDRENPYDIVTIDLESKVIGAYIIADSLGVIKLVKNIPSRDGINFLRLTYPITVTPLKVSKSMEFTISN